MKRIYSFILFLFITFFISGCTTATNSNDIENLIISVSEVQASELEAIVTAFNDKYDGTYQIKFDISLNEDVKNYKLSHNDIYGDIIVFDSFNTANQFGSDYLIDLTLDDTVDKYQSSIISYIKDNDERLFCFPSLGRFYANFFNLDIINKYNFSVPSTLDELLTLAKRSELKVESSELMVTSSTIGGNDSILFALMQIAFPEFLATTKGNYFLKEFKKENANMGDSEYCEYFKSIFRKFHQLYYSSYYSLDDLNKTLLDGVNDYVSGKSMVLQTSIDYQYDNVIGLENSILYPFAGNGKNQEWIASKPLFYLGVNKNISTDKYQAAKAFFQYFTSSEGQNIMSDDTGRLPKNKCFISYVKDVYLELGSEYENMIKPIEEGRIFIVDTFFQIFGGNVDSLVKYLKNSISIDDLIKVIDKRNYKANSDAFKINILGNFDYDEFTFDKKESKIGDYFTDTLRKYVNVGAVILDNNLIKANIYSDGLLSSELDTIINDTNLVYKKISVYELYYIVKQYIDSSQIPLISGIRISNGLGGIAIYDQAGNILNKDDSIVVLIDEKILNSNNMSHDTDRKIDLIQTFKKILNNQTNITVPKLDNRYGGLDFSKEK